MRWKTMAMRLAVAFALVLLACIVVAHSGARGIESGLNALPDDSTGRDPLAPQFEVRWFTQAGGGADGPLALGDWSVSSTLGQVAIGRAGSLPNRLCAGFWCAWQPYWIYLPVVLKGA
jgi:hypothetical protein